MSEITVIRGLGDRQGPDIVDPLLHTDQLKIARVRAAIDEATPVIPMSVSLPLSGWVASGSMVEATDIELQQYRGVVDSCELVYDIAAEGEFTATTTLNIERLPQEEP